jgi:hypothetical protein
MTIVFELIGIATCVWFALWAIGRVWVSIELAVRRRRAVARAALQDRLRRLAVCDHCGSRGRVHFEAPHPDSVTALRAIAGYVDHAQARQRAR